jgi:hypothetical protein
MFRYIGDQADRLSGGLIGATLGVIFSMSASSIGAAIALLVTFFVLLVVQSLPRYFAHQTNGTGIRQAFLVFLGFVILWTVYFCNFYVFREGWSQKDIDLRVFLALFTLLIASIVSIVSVTAEGME